MNREAFARQFGCDPEVTTVAPGRINLIGEHVDYLGGEVMPIAIDRKLVIHAAPVSGDICEIFPVGFGHTSPTEISLEDLHRREAREEVWLNYIIGVLSVYRDAGVELPAFRATIQSDLPAGAGLSSSAALETAVALVVEALTGIEQDPVDRALLCQRAEHEFAGVPCGIMDQLAVGAGRKDHVMRLDCGDLTRSYVPIPEDLSILTADTGVKHALGDGEYRKRRMDCEEALSILGIDSFRNATPGQIDEAEGKLGDRLFRRARHAVTEMERVERFSKALVENDLETLGESMRQSHDSLRDDYEVSCEELDALVDAAYRADPAFGLIGSRMTGGGFGGSTVSLVDSCSASDWKRYLEKFYRKKFGRELNCFITTAVDGAHVLSPS
jgi:galactokinase